MLMDNEIAVPCGQGGEARQGKTRNAMTQSGHSEHEVTGGQPYFSATEWSVLQADDRRAGTIIVVLMGSIFTIGLVLYFTIFLIVRSGT